VNGLFSREGFTGFGPCALDPVGRERPLFGVRARRPGRLREAVRQMAPRSPGIYGMIDAIGDLIYVGKAKSLRSRLLSYFRPDSRDDRSTNIIRQTRRLVWEPCGSEFAALLRELELIRRHQPRLNVQGVPRRQRRVYLCLGRRPAPSLFLAGKPPMTAEAVFGPVAGLRRARQAMRHLSDWYRLRDCPRTVPMFFADQRELFSLPLVPGCIRHELGYCIAPCAAACTQAEYAFHAMAVVDFLEGRDTTPLEQLQRQRDEAAAEQLFERAAVLHARLESLTWLFQHLGRLREAVRESFVYPVDEGGRQTWYLIRNGCVRGAVDAGAGEAARQRLEEVYATGGPWEHLPAPAEVDGLLLVAAWFRRHKAERQRRLTVDEARERLSSNHFFDEEVG
jgi:excinuclease ABC subunit C